jgi:hypothetical protein
MSAELVLLALGLAASGGAAVWAAYRQAQQHFLIRVRTEWMREGRVVHYGPVGAHSYGSRPKSIYPGGTFGALGLVGGHLFFAGHRSGWKNASLAFEQVRWIGLRSITVQAGRATVKKRALVVHADSVGGWVVYTFTTGDLDELARQLAAQCGQMVHQEGREDFGPMNATRLTEDVYGQWHRDHADALYLAPDRLLFGWDSAIHLAQVRRVEVLARTGLESLNPFAGDLLRVEYAGADEGHAAVGFVVRGARKWAEAIARRTQVPVQVHAGRKKKRESSR